MDINARIEKMLIRYLWEEHKIVAVAANLGCTTEGLDDGCDTCGWGSTEMSFDIRYKREDDAYWNSWSVDGDPLGFFPTLLEYDTED